MQISLSFLKPSQNSIHRKVSLDSGGFAPNSTRGYAPEPHGGTASRPQSCRPTLNDLPPPLFETTETRKGDEEN